MTTLLPLGLGSVGEYLVKNILNKPPYLELNPCMPSWDAHQWDNGPGEEWLNLTLPQVGSWGLKGSSHLWFQECLKISLENHASGGGDKGPRWWAHILADGPFPMVVNTIPCGPGCRELKLRSSVGSKGQLAIHVCMSLTNVNYKLA